MEEIKEFFENIKRIRMAVESLVPEKTEPDRNESSEAPVVNPPKAVAQTNAINPESVQNYNQSQAPQMPNAIPVTQQAESFTQEQIAVAMSNAMAAGRNDVVQYILTTFNAQCLMQIDPANYNKIATMLREAGIQI